MRRIEYPNRDELIAKAKELRECGFSYQKIADRFGIASGETIHYLIDPEYRERRLAYRHSYYLKNKEKAKAARKEYQHTHKEEIRAYKKQYNAANREKLSKSEKIYRQAHKEKYLEFKRARRVKMHGSGEINENQYDAIWQEQNGLCYYCDEPMLREGNQYNPSRCNVEHIKPASDDGIHALSNIVLACRKCNYSKGKKLVEDWMPSILPKIAANPRLRYDIEEAHMRWLI